MVTHLVKRLTLGCTLSLVEMLDAVQAGKEGGMNVAPEDAKVRHARHMICALLCLGVVQLVCAHARVQ